MCVCVISLQAFAWLKELVMFIVMAVERPHKQPTHSHKKKLESEFVGFPPGEVLTHTR